MVVTMELKHVILGLFQGVTDLLFRVSLPLHLFSFS